MIKQIQRQLPEVVLVISLYLFCLNFAIYKLEDSHEVRRHLYQMYTLGLASSFFSLCLLIGNIFSIILTAQSARKKIVQTIYIIFFSCNALWICWTLM